MCVCLYLCAFLSVHHLQVTRNSDPSHREVCCLPGAQVRVVARKLPGLVWPSDYYPLLVMQVGSDEMVERSPKAIKRDFRALGRLVEGWGCKWCFPPSHQWQGTALKGAGNLTWLTGGSGTGAIGWILSSLITERYTQQRACWRQADRSYLKGEKGFLSMSWRGSLRGL